MRVFIVVLILGFVVGVLLSGCGTFTPKEVYVEHTVIQVADIPEDLLEPEIVPAPPLSVNYVGLRAMPKEDILRDFSERALMTIGILNTKIKKIAKLLKEQKEIAEGKAKISNQSGVP